MRSPLHRHCVVGFVAMVVVTSAASPVRPEASARAPALAVPRASSEIVLDGRLDEAAWKSAALIEELTQQDPNPGGPTSFHTRVRLLAGASSLYVGIECIDPAPGRIAVHTLQRDGDMTGDDSVAVVFDTFGDRRSGFYFRVNAAGARQDGLISNPQAPVLDWDGVWQAAARRTATGWIAEIEIPAQTLRFRRGSETWGFNVERYVARERLTLRWRGISLDSSLVDLRRAGELAGLGELRQGHGLAIAPYGLAQVDRERPADARAHGESGLDVTYNLAPELAAVLTYRTDFAETEVDSRQINLTRFPLFFPEKRGFFLEGSNQFAFATGFEDDSFIPFFSRHIGLVGGAEVPIDGGVKLLGRAGRWEIGALDVETRDSDAAPATNLFAGRLTFDATSHLRFGVIGTRGDPDGIHDNSLSGADAVWHTSEAFGDKNLIASAWGARSSGDLPNGRPTGWGFQLNYPNDLWNNEIDYKEVGDALDPALGFLPRPGTRQLNSAVAFQPRPAEGSAFDWVRQFFFEAFYHRVENLAGNLQTWRWFLSPWNATTRSGEHLELNVQPEFERLTAPFEVAPGIVIPVGSYRFDRVRLEADTATSRPWSASEIVWLGDFFDGRLTQWNSSVAWTSPRAHLHAECALESDFGYLREGHFIDRLLQLKLVYAFTPELVLSSFAQYDSDSLSVGVNNLLRWTVRPGRDLFVVWNRSWNRPTGDALRFFPAADQLSAKLRWTLWW